MALPRLARALGAAGLLALAPAALVAGALVLALPARGQEPAPKGGLARDVKVTWYGQACFEFDFPTGLVVLVDPFGDGIGTYRFPRHVKPDVVTISHEHFDHNNDKAVAGTPQVLRGLTSAEKDKQDWNKHDLVVKGVHIRSVALYHDEKNGTERGKNAAFVFQPEKKGDFASFVHLGDLGHTLTDEQAKAIGSVDCVLVPVGGHFTVDAVAAKKVCDALRPAHAVVPMHYKTPALKPELPLASADAFLALWEPGRIQRVEGNSFEAFHSPPFGRELPDVIVPGYEPAPAIGSEPGGGEPKKEEPVAEKKPGTVKIAEARAWINKQPPAGSLTLNFTLEVEAQAGDAGGTLAVSGAFVRGGSNVVLGPDDFEEDGGANEPKGGWTLKPGEKKHCKLVSPEALSHTVAGAGKNSVTFTATLTPRGGGKPVTDTVSPAIQDVR